MSLCSPISGSTIHCYSSPSLRTRRVNQTKLLYDSRQRIQRWNNRLHISMFPSDVNVSTNSIIYKQPWRKQMITAKIPKLIAPGQCVHNTCHNLKNEPTWTNSQLRLSPAHITTEWVKGCHPNRLCMDVAIAVLQRRSRRESNEIATSVL